MCVNTCVYSGYCMEEFDVAYHHNIMVKRKKRLIVLMMLDRPSELCDNDASSDTEALGQYLRQYTYIDYNSDDWLDKLLYTLPLCGLLQPNQRPEGSDETPNLHDNEDAPQILQTQENISNL